MSIGIYALYYGETCLYVGQSKDIEQRYKRHIIRLKAGTALQKFNEWFQENNCPHESIELKILEECEDNDLIKNELEIKWFNDLSPLFYGKVPSLKDTWSHSEETRKKISDSVRHYKTDGGKIKSRVDIVRLCKNCSKEFSSSAENPIFCSRICFESDYRKSVEDRNNLIITLHDSGLSLREIAREVSISHVAVKKIIDSFPYSSIGRAGGC